MALESFPEPNHARQNYTILFFFHGAILDFTYFQSMKNKVD